MSNSLEKHDGNVSIGSRTLTVLRFADDIDALAKEGLELETPSLKSRQTYICIRYKTEIIAEKARLMPTATVAFRGRSVLWDRILEQFTSLKYLGATVSDEDSNPEVLSRIKQATAALKKLKPV